MVISGVTIVAMARTPDKMSVSQFKATCLEVLERVRRTGRPLLITKRGIPLAEVVPPTRDAAGAEWIGTLRDSATITGDIIGPALSDTDWESFTK